METTQMMLERSRTLSPTADLRRVRAEAAVIASICHQNMQGGEGMILELSPTPWCGCCIYFGCSG